MNYSIDFLKSECDRFEEIDLQNISLNDLKLLDNEIKKLANIVGNYINPFIKQHKRLCNITYKLDSLRMFFEIKDYDNNPNKFDWK